MSTVPRASRSVAGGGPKATGGFRSTRLRRIALAALAMAVLVPPALVLDASVASAAPTFTVTSTVDAPDAAIGNGVCATAAAVCSLRAAVAEANATTGAQIVVPAGTYLLNSASGSDVGDLDLKKPMTITGAGKQPGASATTVNGNAKDRVFEVLSTDVVLDGLVITNGNVGSGLGGGVFVNSGKSLTVRNSTVAGNKASYGGGIKTYGVLNVERSTFSGNTATTRGGGVYVTSSGNLTASDSTFNANTSAGGGAIGSAGTVKLNAVTVSANAAGSSKGGGIWREGGSFTIAGSILAANTATTGPNCFGSPALAGTNIVQSTTGCTSSGTAALAVDPKLGALGDNGGSTLTRLPDAGSPAINAYAPACVTTADQRGLSRSPTPGGKCDIGSVEVDPITVDVALTSSAPPRSPACDEGTVCVGTGVSSVPIDRIPSAALVAETDPDADPTGFKRTFLERTDAARLGFKRTDLLSSPVSELTVEDLGFKRTGFKRTGFKRTSILDQVLLSQIPLYLAGGRTWEDLLTGTEFDGVPLQNVTLGDVVELPQIQALTVGEADFISTALQGLSGAALALAPLNLDDIPIGDDPNPLTGWCDFLTTQSQGGCADLEIDPNDPATAAGVGLVTLELSGVRIEDIPLEDIGFKRTDVTGTYLADIGFKRTDLSGGRIGQVDVRQVGPVDALFDCAKIACNGTVTLAGAQQAGAIRDGATIGELLEYLSAHPEAQGLNILDLLLILTPVVFPGEAVAIEQIDLRATPLQNLSDPLEAPATFTATITSGGGSPADTTVNLTLPPGFEPVAGSAAFDGAPIADGSRDGQTLTFRRTSLAVGQHTLVVNARAGIDLGSKEASVDVRATAGSQAVTDSATASVLVVVESFEKNGAPDDFRSLNPGSVNVAHLSSSYDRDLYSFYVSPDDASRNRTTRLDLSNLTGDYDLVLYGPSAASLRGDAPRARLQPVDDTGLDINPTADQVAPDVQSDVPLTPPPDCGVPGTQQSCEPYAVSAQRGTKNELIESGTLIAGTYWVEVRGYNGAFGPEPYVVRRIDAQGEPLGACAPRSSSSAAPGPLVTYPAGITAATATGHMLVPEGRFRQQYGDTETQSVLDALSAVAAASSAAVVRIDADPGVKAAYDAWDAEPCSVDASNNVVRAIGKLLDRLEAQSPNAASVTLLGTHVMTPFGLVPDGTTVANESSYDPGVSAGQDTSLTAALAAGYVQTDNPYGTSAGYAINAAELYVPERAVGRLVESPADIRNALRRFVDFGGVLDPSTTTSAFVSGYDFIGDGAAAAADALRDQGAGVTELINETWDRQNLKDGVIGGDPDVASISAHFDHNRALPASGNKSGLGENFTVSDVAGAGNLTNALVFSIGCHSGLSVPDVELALTDRADWAQTFAGEGATYLGNTGYGFGDTELVAYSERLQLLFAQELQGGTPVGSALMAAKQAYFAELAVLTPYDQKVISEMTMYGLPMWRVGGALDAPTPVASVPTANAALAAPEPPDTVVQEPFVLSVGGPGTPSGPGVLAPKDTGNGTYYDVDGNVLTVQYRPAQPSVDRDVSRPGRRAHGALILDAESQDLTGFKPYYVQPVIDEAANEQSTDPVGDAVFPATLARVANPVAADGSRSSSLVVAAGQFRRNGEAAGTGVQRLFTRLDTAVTYADASETDFDPPSIVRSEASVVESTVGFSVRASTDTERVYVLYKVAGGGPGNWEGVDLVRTGTDPVDGSALWTGGAVLPSADLKIEYLGQAVDHVGNVAYTVNKTTNFLAAPAEDCSLDATLSPPDTLTDSGWYRAADGVTVTFAQQGLQVSVDGGEFQAVPAGGLLITGEGVHRVSANSADARCTVIVPIDTRGPEIGATLDAAPNAGGWNAGPVNLNISASDPGGSGVRQVTYAVNGGAPVTVDGDSASVPVDTRGDTTVTYSAVDAAGNAGTSGTTTIRIDGGVPTVTSVVVPAPANGWNRGPVSVDITATDAETGIREIRTALGGAPPVVVPGASASVPVTAEGTTTVGYTAVDNAGNEATGSAEVRIDSVVPGIAITSPPANVATGAAATAGFTCSDQTSGVASCTATLAGPGVLQPVANGDPLPTTVNGSYTLTVTSVDVAGNTASAVRTYAVGYGVCLKYNAATAQPVLATLVLRVQLCDAAGNNLSAPGLALAATKVDGTITPRRNVWGLFNLGFGFYYDASARTYIYALPTIGIGAGPHNLGFTVNGAAAPNYVLPFTLR